MNSIACLNNCETQKEDDTTEFEQEIRIDKILSVLRELGEGRYDVAEKLDVVADRMLEELLNG